jgi:hypothetical protein
VREIGYLLKPQFLLSSKYLLYTNIFRTTAVMKAETDIITSIAESKGIPVLYSVVVMFCCYYTNFTFTGG